MDTSELGSLEPFTTPAEVAVSPRGLQRMGAGLMLGLTLAGMAAGLTGCGPSGPPPPISQTHDLGTESTYVWFSTEDEVALGKQVAARVEGEVPLWKNDAAQQTLDRLGARLASTSNRHDITYTFKLLDTDQVNAMAIPGGTIYVTRGLYENYMKLGDEDMLTFVMGHEMGHVEHRHSVKAMGKAALLQWAVRVATNDRSETARVGAQLAEQLLEKQFSQAAESEADGTGQAHLKELGINTWKAVRAMQLLQRLTGGQETSRVATRILSDHPPTRDRIQALEEGARRYGDPRP